MAPSDKSQEKPYKGKKEDWVEVKNQPANSLSRKDVFFMSFLATLLVVAVSAGLFFTGNTLYAVLESSGEEEVVQEDVTGQSVEETAPEVVVEAPVEEEPECTADADCGDGYVCENEACVAEPFCEDTEVTLAVGEKTTFKGKTVLLKLSAESAAQVSVGGKAQLLSWGETAEINGVSVQLSSASEESATLELLC